MTSEADDLLFYKLKDLIIEQSEGEWTDAQIITEARHFADVLRPMLAATPPVQGEAVTDAMMLAGRAAGNAQSFDVDERIGWVQTRAIYEAMRAAAPPPVLTVDCQACGGHIEGWTCQGCSRTFRENAEGAMIMDAVLTGEGVREAVARIIDPWPFGVVANIQFTARATDDREAALEKADRILAALSPVPSQAVEGEGPQDQWAELERLALAAAKRAPGLWGSDIEKGEGSYGSGDDDRTGFMVPYMETEHGKRLFDAHYCDVAEIHEDYDSDEHGSYLYAWDEAAREIFAFIAAVQPVEVLKLIAAARANAVGTERSVVSPNPNANGEGK